MKALAHICLDVLTRDANNDATFDVGQKPRHNRDEPLFVLMLCQLFWHLHLLALKAHIRIHYRDPAQYRIRVIATVHALGLLQTHLKDLAALMLYYHGTSPQQTYLTSHTPVQRHSILTASPLLGVHSFRPLGHAVIFQIHLLWQAPINRLFTMRH